jgi:hypothetical protein
MAGNAFQRTTIKTAARDVPEEVIMRLESFPEGYPQTCFKPSSIKSVRVLSGFIFPTEFEINHS